MEHVQWDCHGEKQEWTTVMDRLGALPVELYRLAYSAPVHQFQELALNAARAALGFDSAHWVLGMMEPDGPVYHATMAYRQPPDSRSFEYQNTLLRESLRRPGQTISSVGSRMTSASKGCGDAIALGQHYGTAQLFGAASVEGGVNLIEGLIFCRHAATRPFSEPERLFIRSLVPQLADTWRINRLLSVQGDRRSTAQPNESLALCDGKRLLHAAGRQFAAMLQAEWKDWRGPFVPADLLKSGCKAFLGSRIVVSATPINDMWLLTARRRSHADRLTARERDIARRFGRGLGYREIAQELRISPSTARNHLKNIYDKLEIRSKVELAGLLRQIDRPPTVLSTRHPGH